MRNSLQGASDLQFILGLFIAGVAAQIAAALLNKWVNWLLYKGAEDPSWKNVRGHSFARHIVRYYGIDVVADVVSVACFAWAAVLAFGHLVPAA